MHCYNIFGLCVYDIGVYYRPAAGILDTLMQYFSIFGGDIDGVARFRPVIYALL